MLITIWILGCTHLSLEPLLQVVLGPAGKNKSELNQCIHESDPR